MSSPPRDPNRPTRRQRGRDSAVLEIKAAALEELRVHGASGVTMRGVARAIDMTPSGLYRYFEDHGALLAALCVDACDSLSAALEAVQETFPHDCASRWFHGSLVLRRWALEHVAEYGLVVGPRVTGGEAFHPDLAKATGRLLRFPTDTVASAIVNGDLRPTPVSLAAFGLTAPAHHAAEASIEPRAVAIGAVSALVGLVISRGLRPPQSGRGPRGLVPGLCAPGHARDGVHRSALERSRGPSRTLRRQPFRTCEALVPSVIPDSNLETSLSDGYSLRRAVVHTNPDTTWDFSG